ncbi:MAG: helix-turn-helix domain-containing protein [Lysobacter sp.]
MARSKAMHAALTGDTLAGRVKLRCEELNITLGELAPIAGMKPNTIRARLSKSRGKRALQPWQVTAIAKHLGLSNEKLHRLGAQQEGWKV